MKKSDCSECGRSRWAKTDPTPIKGMHLNNPKQFKCLPCRRKNQK